MREFEPVIEHHDDPARFVVHLGVPGLGGTVCGLDNGVLHADSAEDIRVDLTVHGLCLAHARDNDGEVPGTGRAATAVRALLDQLAEGTVARTRSVPKFDRRRVRIVIEADVSLDGVSAAGPVPRAWGIADEVDRAAVRAISALGGWFNVRSTDFRLTDPPPESTR
jgi:hypothetical protein